MIRRVKYEDIPRILEIYSPYVSKTKVSFELKAPSLEEFIERVNKISSVYPYFVYEEQGRILGYAYASRFRERKAYDVCVEISIYVDYEYRGKGIGTSLLGVLLDALKKQGVTCAVSCVACPNNRSDALHRKMGFIESGVIKNCALKFGEITDIRFFYKILADNSDGLVSYNEVCGDSNG